MENEYDYSGPGGGGYNQPPGVRPMVNPDELGEVDPTK